ncbi:hypothetical protein HDE69_000650 [Pedobacter cryoconitis]|uniref:Uncharacterized protein n=1 Tax=Pedobacter cryoconitis TaxID=188932 RepID=A0A7W9DI25_9SPHI|nr:hypothetical protein [Pedobacter cryoconitis]MBB5619612.1 hypothetical protein [Pedobacter cryoconitis]
MEKYTGNIPEKRAREIYWKSIADNRDDEIRKKLCGEVCQRNILEKYSG